MGRVAKYKKIRSVDPYSKKNRGNVNLSTVGVWGLGDNGRKAKKRSRRSEQLRISQKKRPRSAEEEGFDLPAKRDEFDLKDLTGSVKKQKIIDPLKDGGKDKDLLSVDRVVVNGNVASIPKTDQDERKAAGVLNVKTQVQKEAKQKEAKNHARMEGESKNAYSKRTKAETRQIIKQTTETKNPEKKQKKKEFLNKKKKNKKKASATATVEDIPRGNDNGENDSLITGERAIAEVRFGEQAERPPVFRQLPRGAQNKEGGSMSSKAAKKKAASKGMTEQQMEAENNAMERMRSKIQAQYAAIKLKRRQAGDFHL